jgi:hypothetical protein
MVERLEVVNLKIFNRLRYPYGEKCDKRKQLRPQVAVRTTKEATLFTQLQEVLSKLARDPREQLT